MPSRKQMCNQSLARPFQLPSLNLGLPFLWIQSDDWLVHEILLTYLGPLLFLSIGNQRFPYSILSCLGLVSLRCSMCGPSSSFPPQHWSRLQVFLGRPLFHLPWGFHFRACLVTLSGCFLNVWLIHLHFLRLFCIWMVSWLACFQRSSFGTLFNQDIFKIFLKHLLTNDCSLLLDDFVFLHVSEPNNRTLFTLEFKILNFVLPEMTREFHTSSAS